MENVEFDTVEAGAGSYPEPPEVKEKIVSAEITITFDVYNVVPQNWDNATIEENIKECLGTHIDLNDYKTIDIDLYGVEEID